METEFINRELATVIKETSKCFSVTTVTGPQQSGKTILLQNIFSELAGRTAVFERLLFSYSATYYNRSSKSTFSGKSIESRIVFEGVALGFP